MTYVQIVEFHMADIEEARKVSEEWHRATEGKRTVRREMLARDHSDPDRYYALVFFDSYESAMQNSALPETQAAAEQYQKLSDGPAVFRDLDILEDQA
jgi:quinol monooxygenase YgiN